MAGHETRSSGGPTRSGSSDGRAHRATDGFVTGRATRPGRGVMEYFFKVRVDHTGMSADELWTLWEKEVEAAEGALASGKIKNLYKVSGQRRVIGVIDADSHDELDQILMAGLPMSHVLEWEEIVPVR